jgi:chromosome segregation ATPase
MSPFQWRRHTGEDCVAAMSGGGTRRWGWGSGRAESVRADAQAAKDAAAEAFYELDTAQRDLRISIETITAVDNSPAARKAAADFAEFGRRIDQVSHGYISVVDSHDLDRDGLDTAAATRALQELGRARRQLEQARADLERFASSLGGLLSNADTRLDQFAPAVGRGRQSVLAATQALDTARAAGLQADDLAARLAALGPELTKLNQGAGQHGVRETIRRAEDVRRQAETIRREADRLPEKAAELDRRLASLRTRAQALATRAGKVEPVLSELRRRFSAACWQDLQPVPGQAQRAAQEAEQKVREAQRARDEQRWEDATALLASVRALLNTTDGAVAAAGERLQRLNEVSFNHEKETERARFAIRDAQRLAMAGRNTPEPRHAGPLDDAVVRLDRALAELKAGGRHPDYWQFLTELDAIKETAAQVVQDIRESRGMGR